MDDSRPVGLSVGAEVLGRDPEPSAEHALLRLAAHHEVAGLRVGLQGLLSGSHAPRR